MFNHGLVKTVSFVVFFSVNGVLVVVCMFVQWCPSDPGFDGPRRGGSGVEAG